MTLQEFTAWLDGYLTGCAAPDKAAIMAKLREVAQPAAPVLPMPTPNPLYPNTGTWPAAPSVRPKWPGVPWLEPVVSLGSPDSISTFSRAPFQTIKDMAPLPGDMAKVWDDNTDTLYQN